MTWRDVAVPSVSASTPRSGGETRAFGARPPGFSRFTPGSWGAS